MTKENSEQELIERKLKELEKNRTKETKTISEISQRDARKEIDEDIRQDMLEAEERTDKEREPAMIEAQAVEDIANALHDPNRKKALLHTHIQEGMLAAVGEMEMIERDSMDIYFEQLMEYSKWLRDTEVPSDDEPELLEFYNKKQARYRDWIIENGLDLRGMMMGGNEAFELAFSAYKGARAAHGVQNISSVVTGSKNTPDYEAEGAKGFLRKFRERLSRGE